MYIKTSIARVILIVDLALIYYLLESISRIIYYQSSKARNVPITSPIPINFI